MATKKNMLRGTVVRKKGEKRRGTLNLFARNYEGKRKRELDLATQMAANPETSRRSQPSGCGFEGMGLSEKVVGGRGRKTKTTWSPKRC